MFFKYFLKKLTINFQKIKVEEEDEAMQEKTSIMKSLMQKIKLPKKSSCFNFLLKTKKRNITFKNNFKIIHSK